MKAFLKSVVRMLCAVLVAPLAAIETLSRHLLRRDVCFAGHSQYLSLLPGKLGSYMRVAYYRKTLDECSMDCYIGFGTLLAHSQAKLSSGVYVGAYCILGKVSVGEDTMLADGVRVLSGAHQHSFQDRERPFQEQPTTFVAITIGKNSWLGTNSVIMADIGDDCVIGAGSIVTRTIPAGQVAVGSPAKVIRSVYAHESRA